MSDWLPSGALLGAFVLASLVLAVTPGPGVVYIVTRTLAQGRRAGQASVLGVALGNAGNALASALGLAVLFAWSAWAFDVVRYAGAAYLAWLAWTTWRSAGVAALPAIVDDRNAKRADDVATGRPIDAAALRRVVRDGALVALLNPKTTLFFAAFLPQFIDPQRSAGAQSVALGLLFVAIAAASDALVVAGAGLVAPALARAGRRVAWGARLSALVYLGLAAWTALTGQRPGRFRRSLSC